MEDENEKNVNTGADNKESVGTNERTKDEKSSKNVSQTFDEFLKDPKNQAEFDRRLYQSNKTAVANAEEKMRIRNDSEKSEAEKLSKMTELEREKYKSEKYKKERDEAIEKNNAHDMKEEALKIANEKGLDISLVSFINFKGTTAETVKTDIDKLSTAFNKAVENAVNLKLREKTPQTKGTKETKKKEISRASY